MTGIELIAQERKEQIEKHGITVDNDVDFNKHYQLSIAASNLCVDPLGYMDDKELGIDNEEYPPEGWDMVIWKKMYNKPYKERLIIAEALIAAEIDRLQKTII